MANFNYVTGHIHWAKVLGDPVPNYNRDGNEWTFDFTPDDEHLGIFDELGIKAKLKNKDDERKTFIQFKQKEKRADGSANLPITIVDARNHPWDPAVKIGNGSYVEVKFKVVPYKTTVGVYPQAIRVLELVPYVRQEFAPLPEDNEFVQKVPLDEVFEALDEDPLNVDE